MKTDRTVVAASTQEDIECELERTLDRINELAESNSEEAAHELRALGMRAAGLLGMLRGRLRRWQKLRMPENLQQKLDDTWGRDWRNW